MSVIVDNNKIYLSYKYLQDQGVKYDTVLSWGRKNLTVNFGRYSYIQYDLIPEPTKAKLPSESEIIAQANAAEQLTSAQIFANYLRECVKNSAKFTTKYIQDDGVSAHRAFEYGKKRAILEGLVTISNDFSTGGRLRKGYLEPIALAYREVAKCKTNDVEVSRLISNCKKFGYDHLIIDNRKGGNNKAFGDDYMYMLTALLSGGNNLNKKQAHTELSKACKKLGISAPSLSWTEKKAREIEYNPEVYKAKYGSLKSAKRMPFAKIVRATHADDQYQIDGYTLPFFCKIYDDSGKSSIGRLVLIAVKDAYSGKIIGYSIGESENRYTLYEALYDAYTKTGALPFEIVTDNHAYNLTEVIENFKLNAEQLGMVWTVDSNPQRKAIVERGFLMMAENHMKHHKGYLGQSVLSKLKHGRVSQDMIDRYYQNSLSVEEVKLIAASAILEFNDTPYENQQLSPNALYEASEKPSRIELNIFSKMKLFTLMRQYKVSRGQITIESNGVKYEYQLNAEQIHKYNDKRVTVRFEDYDTIYLFDQKTDMPIGAVRQKQGIHGALANQTDGDLHNLNKNTGRLKGLISISRKELEDRTEKAEAIRPGITHMMESLMTPKDVKKELQQNIMLQQEAERMEINKDRIVFSEPESLLSLQSLKSPEERKREKQPHAPKNHKIGILKLNDEQ